MLKFTKEQQEFVLNARRLHEQQHKLMANQVGQMLVGNASPLPRDVWGQWDREGIEIQREELVIFNDLANAVSQPMPIGKLVNHFQTIGDSGSVNISLDGRSRAKTDQPLIEYHGTPLPILDSTFSYGWRQVKAAQTEGVSLDPAARANAQRRIAEKLEDIALNGDDSIRVGEAELFGLRNHPQRGVRTTGVVLNGATGAEWVAEIKATLKVLHDSNFKTDATIYVNWDDWFFAGSTDYSANYANKTIAQRVMELPGVGQIIAAPSVPANELIALVKRNSVIQVLNGMPLTSRAKFRPDPEDDYNFVVLAAAALQMKFDANGQMGLAHSVAE